MEQVFFINKSRSSGQKKHLNDLIEYFKDKTIYYFPHRDEKIDSNIFRKLHVEIINIPIEPYLLQSNVLPKNICGFYSTALYTLKKYLLEDNINVINLNFNFKNYNWDDYDDFDFMVSFDQLLKNTGVKQFYK